MIDQSQKTGQLTAIIYIIKASNLSVHVLYDSFDAPRLHPLCWFVLLHPNAMLMLMLHAPNRTVAGVKKLKRTTGRADSRLIPRHLPLIKAYTLLLCPPSNFKTASKSERIAITKY